MTSGASLLLLLSLIHRSHAQMEVRVQIFTDNTCTGTATADHQVPFTLGGQGQGTPLTAAYCSVLPDAHSTALGVAAGSFMGIAGECTSDENKFAFYCTGSTKSACEASLVDKEGKGDDAITSDANCHFMPTSDFTGGCTALGSSFKTYTLSRTTPLAEGTLTATGYSATDCSGTGATQLVPLNGGCVAMNSDYMDSIGLTGSYAEHRTRVAGWHGDATTGYYSCSSEPGAPGTECELLVTCQAPGRCDTGASDGKAVGGTCNTGTRATSFGVTYAAGTKAATSDLLVTFTLAGVVSDYDLNEQAAIQTEIAKQASVARDDVALVLTSGSVVIDATITVPATLAAATKSSLAAGMFASAASLQTALQTQSVLSSVVVSSVTAPVASGPPSAPPSAGGSGGGDSSDNTVWIIVGVAAPVAAIAAAIVAWMCIKRQRAAASPSKLEA